jgi:hypothetical protein
MLITSLDDPQPFEVECRICGKPMIANWYWFEGLNKWLRSSVHDKCLDQYDARKDQGPVIKREIPERFRDFKAVLFPDQDALLKIQEFDITTSYHVLAIRGAPALGKSRLMWNFLPGFFNDLRTLGINRWVDYFLFADLLTEFGRDALRAVKDSKYAFIDDVGATECYGRERAQLQQVIRARVQRGHWTFLTIDNMDFDPGLDDVFKGRAVCIDVVK